MHSPAPLTGCAIGDALGMPFETLGPTSSSIFGWAGGYTSSSYHSLQPGQWTDDTQMSLALAESLLRCGKYDPVDAARGYLAWFQDHPRGIGSSTQQAMQKLASGAPWTHSGILGAEGNGSAMRVGPLGLFDVKNRTNIMVVAREARTDSNITHSSHEAREGAVAVALAVTHLARGNPKGDLLDVLLENLEKSQVRAKIERLKWQIKNASSLKEVITDFGWILGGVGAHVVQTVPAALTLFLFSENFPDTVQNAVRMGGDTDTTAAIAGAMAGAHYGYNAIPKALLDPLERANDIRAIELRLIG